MSRFIIKLSLALALGSATAAAHSFAQPPTPAPTPALTPPSTPAPTPPSTSGLAHADATTGAHAERRFAPPVVDRAAVRAALLEQRRANIARFHAYRIGGVYPSNVFTGGLANVWQDQQGHFCAAATIIRASGQIALVDRIAEDDNFFRIADVSQGPVMDWILTSGLTQAELVMIQRPFRPVASRPALEPTTPIAINPKLRAAESRRLAALYRQIEHKLVKNQRASLERAVERVMARPDLAQQLVGGSTAS